MVWYPQLRRIALCGVVLIAITASVPEAAEETTSPYIRAELSLPEKTAIFYPLLPVLLNYRIINDTSLTLRVPPPIYNARLGAGSWVRHPFRIFVGEGPNGQSVRRFPWTLFENEEMDSVQYHSTLVEARTWRAYPLLLGWERSVVVQITTGTAWIQKPDDSPEQAFFSKPGHYRVKVRVVTWPEKPAPYQRIVAESQELPLEIASPKGQDWKAYSLLVKSKCPWALSHPGHLGNGLVVCQEIFNRYPQSAYYPYAKMVVANDLLSNILPDSPKKQPSEILRGLEMLREVCEDQTFPFTDFVATLLCKRAHRWLLNWINEAYDERSKGLESNAKFQLRFNRKVDTEINAIPRIKQAREYEIYAEKKLQAFLSPEEQRHLHFPWRDRINELLFEKYGRYMFSYD